jgi:carbamate kinase
MTNSSKSLSQKQIDFLETSRILYLPIAGGWPPNVRDRKELEEIHTLISKDIQSAKLFVEEKPVQIHEPIAEKSSKSWWKLW